MQAYDGFGHHVGRVAQRLTTVVRSRHDDVEPAVAFEVAQIDPLAVDFAATAALAARPDLPGDVGRRDFVRDVLRGPVQEA